MNRLLSARAEDFKSNNLDKMAMLLTMTIVVACAMLASISWFVVFGFAASLLAFAIIFLLFAGIARALPRMSVLRLGGDFSLWFILLVPTIIEFLVMTFVWPASFGLPVH